MNTVVTVSALALVGVVSKWQLSRRSPEPALESDRVTPRKAKSDQITRRTDLAEEEEGLPITDPNWRWASYDEFTVKGKKQVVKRDAKKGEEAERGPFRVIYRNEKHQQWPDAVRIHLSSKPLCKIIGQYIPDNGDLITLAEPDIQGRDLWIVVDKLKNHEFGSDGNRELGQTGLANGNGELQHHALVNGDLQTHEGNGELQHHALVNGDLQTHEQANGGDHASREDSQDGKEVEEGELSLKHLLRFMEKEYRDVPVRVQRMQREKRVAWDILWAFLTVGKKVVYNCDHSGELLYAVVAKNYFQLSAQGWLFIVELNDWEFDGREFGKCRISRQIQQYEGERPFAGLAVCPAELLGTPEVLEARFLENGRKYFDLTMNQKHRFMHYAGPLFQQRSEPGGWQLHKENADGRVMVDLASFARMNPHYPMSNARPPTSSKYVGAHGSVSFAPMCQQSQQSEFAASDVSEENLIFAPGIVYGFSFTLKMWGSFAINGFRDISFDSSAFHELVMEPQTKDLVHNLVSYYITEPAVGSKPLHRVDPISNKGNGCVFLCYGPPGTGKTLTAESIAEAMGRPLWSLSVSELGTTPKELEQTLFKVLDIAAAWKAVLLLDEADVYLERRISGADLTRNAMTGVFLRMLEYYRGVLFLTTNRIGTFDEAFRSRISVFLHYPTLSTQHKGEIWKRLLDKARITNVSETDLSDLGALDLNGREIRNSIHTAQSWAESKGETPELRHIQYVMGVVSNSLKALNESLSTAAYT